MTLVYQTKLLWMKILNIATPQITEVIEVVMIAIEVPVVVKAVSFSFIFHLNKLGNFILRLERWPRKLMFQG